MLHSERVRLRAIEPSDLDLIVKWRNSPSTYDRFIEYSPISSIAQRNWYEAQLRSNNELNFIACDYQDIAFGTISLQNIDMRNRKAEWGRFLIGDEKYLGKGYGKEILKLLIDYSFLHIGLNKIYCEVLVENLLAITLYEKMGFVREGTLKSHVYKNGCFKDIAIYSLCHILID